MLRAALCIILLSCALGCKQRERTATCAPCSAAFRSNAPLQAQIEAQWRTVAKKVTQPPGLDLRCLCFGTGPSTSIEGQTINLPADWDVREQTARAAHLALHRQQPPWPLESDATCAARVERALAAEIDAHALELETRSALGVATTRYPFEADYLAAPPAQRRRWLHDYLVAHPNGDGVIPGFVSQYRARCQ
jgi:hypothetical protein